MVRGRRACERPCGRVETRLSGVPAPLCGVACVVVGPADRCELAVAYLLWGGRGGRDEGFVDVRGVCGSGVMFLYDEK